MQCSDPYLNQWAKDLEIIDAHPLRLINWLLQDYGITIDVRFLNFQSLSPSLQADIEAKLKRLQLGEPISKVIGSIDFYGFTFKTNVHTLDPRPDSETIIDVIKEYFPADAPLRLLDLGTGTGCLILTLLKIFPMATGVAVDLSNQALSVAADNARALGVADRLEFVNSNWFDELKPQMFDCILSNPPYIADNYPLSRSVSEYDPPLALFAGPDGLEAYRCLFKGMQPFCTLQTLIVFEIGYDQFESVPVLAKSHGFHLQKSVKDKAGITRVLTFTFCDEESNNSY